MNIVFIIREYAEKPKIIDKYNNCYKVNQSKKKVSICKTCGEEDCDKHSFFIGKTVKLEKFSGSTPPEIFVGKWNYPNVYAGILAPQEVGDTTIMSSPEEWHKKRLPISDILGYRNQLIYGRTQSNIKKLETKFLGVMKEVAMTHKSVATEFHLKNQLQQIKNKMTEVR